MAGDDDDVLAADIICSLRGGDLAGWTPPWRRPTREEEDVEKEGGLIWPAVARGKRSRRRSPAARGKKGRWARASPPSPLDYSGGSGSGSGSGASTSGGEDGAGFFSLGRHRPAPMTKMGPVGRPHLSFPGGPPLRPTGQRARKKMRLPEVQQVVQSLAVENESLREEMRALQRACIALSKENHKLETRFELSSSQKKTASKEEKGKQQLDQQSVPQSGEDSFVLPDLNLPAQDISDGSIH